MPHLVILYTPNLDKPASQGGVDMSGLCRALADAMLAVRDEQDKQVFPTGGTRVLAYPAAHSAISDGGAAGIAAGLGGELPSPLENPGWGVASRQLVAAPHGHTCPPACRRVVPFELEHRLLLCRGA